jgi:hypothetical protein
LNLAAAVSLTLCVADFDEFVECYKPGAMHKREAMWGEANADGRWRCYTYDEILKRDKLSLDPFWIKDKSLTDTEALPAPDTAPRCGPALRPINRLGRRLPPGRRTGAAKSAAVTGDQ